MYLIIGKMFNKKIHVVWIFISLWSDGLKVISNIIQSKHYNNDYDTCKLQMQLRSMTFFFLFIFKYDLGPWLVGFL